MSTAVWMIELAQTSWRVSVEREGQNAQLAAEEFAPSELVSQADRIQAVLAANGYEGEAVVVALDSDRCLAATVAIKRASELRDAEAMAFRFEEWIPWGAEDFVADFRQAGSHALAVATLAEPVAPFLGRLAELGVRVESVVPWALLVAAAHAARDASPDRYAAVIERSGYVDLLAFDGAELSLWKWLPAHTLALIQELECLALETGAMPRLVSYQLNDGIAAELTRHGYVIEPAVVEAGPVTDLALTAAAGVARGVLAAPIELKRGRFGRSRGHVALRRYMLGLQAAVAVLLLTLSTALVYRGHEADRQAERFAAEQAEAFQSVFPTAKVPVGIAGRLRSELAKLKGLQGNTEEMPDAVSATIILHRMLSAMPDDRRFRLLEIRIEEGRLYLDGEVREHGDAEVMAQRLRGEGFDVPPPKTQRLDGERVALRISGNLSPVNGQLAKTAP